MDKTSIGSVFDAWDAAATGADLHRLVRQLYPICRSITGDGLRESLRRLGERVPLQLHEVASGTRVFDWEVPREWNIRDAYIKDSQGSRVVDFQQSTLHVLNYSVPVHTRLSLEKLRPHLFTLPDHPDWIPYRTSYYKEAWGFCLAHRQLEAMTEGEYEVCIDATLQPGSLTYAECEVPGETEAEVLVSAHACHPSLCNDNLSGMTVAAELARRLRGLRLRHTYRFVWIPGTIGAITWLARNESRLNRIRHGLVLSCLGDPGPFTYKRSRHGRAEIDRAVALVHRQSGQTHRLVDFSPYGYDERQYGSPGINLPVGCFMRTPHGEYPQYHTSADNPDLVTPEALAGSLHRLLQVVEVLELNGRYRNLNPKCEPQLGRRGLYRQMGGTRSTGLEEAMLWVLNFSDGQHSLLDIAERAGLPFAAVAETARVLQENELLTPVPAGS